MVVEDLTDVHPQRSDAVHDRLIETLDLVRGRTSLPDGDLFALLDPGLGQAVEADATAEAIEVTARQDDVHVAVVGMMVTHASFAVVDLLADVGHLNQGDAEDSGEVDVQREPVVHLVGEDVHLVAADGLEILVPFIASELEDEVDGLGAVVDGDERRGQVGAVQVLVHVAANEGEDLALLRAHHADTVVPVDQGGQEVLEDLVVDLDETVEVRRVSLDAHASSRKRLCVLI